MSDNSQRLFLSERAIKLHTEYVRELELKYSILKKSVPELSDNAEKVMRQRLDRSLKREALYLLLDIECHKLYFESFTAEPKPSELIKKAFGSEESLVYAIYKRALKQNEGFICVARYKGDRFRIGTAEELYPFKTEKIIAIDVCEHAYFTDYFFDKEKYLRTALGFLNLSKLDE